ncbi:MAG: hypothetical protein JXD19_02920 [Deltaproteobacteria bacterium]|nr:hypothetical protein [Deltaproteobacteria bacterium]
MTAGCAKRCLGHRSGARDIRMGGSFPGEGMVVHGDERALLPGAGGITGVVLTLNSMLC